MVLVSAERSASTYVCPQCWSSQVIRSGASIVCRRCGAFCVSCGFQRCACSALSGAIARRRRPERRGYRKWNGRR